ncbi:hypothetical protein PIROE2DRAFT_12278, partial [Piromyces sp. E2]
ETEDHPNDGNILDKNDLEPTEIILEDENNISVIIEKEKDSTEGLILSPVTDIVINENEILDTNNIISLTTDNPSEKRKSFRLTSSCSMDSFDKIMKSNSGSHGAISEGIKMGQDNPQNPNNEKINVRPNSLSSLDHDKIKANSINQETILEYTCYEQVPPLKSKRPSLNFMKHITGFSELSKTKTKNKGSSKEETKIDMLTTKKNGSIKKVIIRSDSNIIGHFDNVIVKEKKNKSCIDTNSVEENDVNIKKSSKIFEDNPNHSVSFSGTGNSRHNILSSSYVAENEMNSYMTRPYSKSLPATMNYNGNNVMNPDNVDILDQNYESKKNPVELNNIFIDSSSNGNINYNDFLFSDDENVENGEQSNVNHEQSTSTPDTQTQTKDSKKKVKTNPKNVTL